MNTEKKLVILSRSFGSSDNAPFKLLEDNGISYTLVRNDQPQNRELIAEKIGDATAVIVGSDVLDAYVFDRCPNLKIVSKQGVGLDAIDLEEAKRRGITVLNTKTANTEAVADLTLMFMLTLKRRLKENIITTANPDWSSKALSNDLFGSKVGIIGYGNIGRAVARRLKGFKAELYIYDPYVDKKTVDADIHICDLDEMYRNCDVITIHSPLTEGTKNMINESSFEKMKDGVIIINTSRGGLMDYKALYKAILAGKVGGAGLDVYSVEPPKNEPLFELNNVVATPHIAAHTKETNVAMGMAAAQNVINCFNS